MGVSIDVNSIKKKKKKHDRRKWEEQRAKYKTDGSNYLYKAFVTTLSVTKCLIEAWPPVPCFLLL